MARIEGISVQVERDDQRALMGYVSGWMYVAVGILGMAGLTVPALRFHPGWQLGLGLGSACYGLLTVRDLPRWASKPMGAHIAAMAAALPVIAVAVWATGGAESYLRPVLLLAPIHWGFFVSRRGVLAALCAGLILAFWTPLIYQPAAAHQTAVAVTATVCLTVICLAASMALIRRRLQAAEQELRRLTMIDPLTGLLNRRGFDSQLDTMVAATPPRRTPFMVLLDLDDLKALNDTYGHAAGDEALRTFAERLLAASREGDLLARIGGDEFALAAHTSDPEAVDRIASRLTVAVAGALAGVGVRISATSGWAAGWERGSDPPGGDGVNDAGVAEAMYRRADERLLANKRRRSCRPPLPDAEQQGVVARQTPPQRGPEADSELAVGM